MNNLSRPFKKTIVSRLGVILSTGLVGTSLLACAGNDSASTSGGEEAGYRRAELSVVHHDG